MARTILHVDLDAFFASVEQVQNPALKGKAVIVGGLSGRGVVASASYGARRFRIKAGMPMVMARLLCPHAIFLEGNFPLYRSYSRKFMHILAGFTPLLEPEGLDEAYLDLTGFHLLYGPPLETARNIKEAIRKELGLTASTGLSTSKVVAKIASDMAKPNGLLEVSPGKEREFLAPLEVGKMPGIGPKTEKRLRELGLYTLGQIAEMPPPLLKDLFGRWGADVSAFSLGKDDRPVELPGEARSISREMTFPSDTINQGYLKGTLASLSEEIGRELRQQGKRARTITLKVRYDDFDTFTYSTTLKEATDSDRELCHRAWQLLEKALGERPRLCRLLGVSASNLEGKEKQLSFFSSSLDRQRLLDRTLDRVRLKYGLKGLQWGRTLMRGASGSLPPFAGPKPSLTRSGLSQGLPGGIGRGAAPGPGQRHFAIPASPV